MEAQVAAYNRGIDLRQQQYETTRSDFMPYTQAGTEALGGLSALLGLPGASNGVIDEMGATEAGRERQRQAIEQLRTGPLYESLYRNGEEALLQTASATGGLRGGNTQRGLADFGSDVLANVYNDQFAKLSGVAGLGIDATGSVANAGLANANAATQLFGQIGDARANNYLTRGGITAGMWKNAGSFLDDIASSFVPGGGGVQGALKSIF